MKSTLTDKNTVAGEKNNRKTNPDYKTSGHVFIDKHKPAKTTLKRQPESDTKLNNQSYSYTEKDWVNIFNNLSSAIRIIDTNKKTRYINDAFCRLTNLARENCVDDYCFNNKVAHICNKDNCLIDDVFNNLKRKSIITNIDQKNNSVILQITAAPLLNPNGKIYAVIEEIKDITSRKKAEEELIKHKTHLEDLVEKRTAEIQKEISERKTTEEQLFQTNKELEIERALLQNKNTALHELMDQIDQKKDQTNQHIQSNIEKVVKPLLNLLKNNLKGDNIHIMNLLDNALTDLLGPTTNKLEKNHFNLSSKEIEICNMVKYGYSSKQIASILNVSVHTVSNQRRSIRKKLNINDNQTNLVTYLKSI